MKPTTIKQLKAICEEEIKNGNGDKVIMLSDDDEGNGYHYLWYSFTDAKDLLDEEMINQDIAKIEDTIVLG